MYIILKYIFWNSHKQIFLYVIKHTTYSSYLLLISLKYNILYNTDSNTTYYIIKCIH